MTLKKITIGTRASPLALWQAGHVKSLIEATLRVAVTLKKITTKGDVILDRSLMDIGGKGLFLKEIEDELLSGSVDIAVHSMKDVPYEMPAGLKIVSILEREDPSDAFVSHRVTRIEDLPQGAVVGTSSLRRLVQLRKSFPHLAFKDLRGNVDTRLAKLDQGQFDAVILATAGLKRLGLSSRICQRLTIVPSVGQGAVGVECLTGRDDLEKILLPLNHQETADAVKLERVFSKRVQGTCQTPVGCFVRACADDPERFVLRCFKASPDGSDYFEREVTGPWRDGESLIASVLKQLPSP